jgi:hypothetical protein
MMIDDAVLSADFIDEAIIRFARDKPEKFARYIERHTIERLRRRDAQPTNQPLKCIKVECRELASIGAYCPEHAPQMRSR